MYEEFFGLRERPFALTPDTGYFFRYRAHQQALDVLLYAVRNGEGFLKVTGEVGTGKTLLCRTLLNALEGECYTAFIPNPALTPDGLRQALARELRLPVKGLDRDDLVTVIYQRLARVVGSGQRVVLCIDEAQALSDEGLETVRLLTNLETEKTKLLQVVLFGQPELDQRLRTPGLRQLQQRISFSYRLEPLDRIAVNSYLNHRLSVAGYNGDPLFTRSAVRQLHSSSGGIPRLVNVIAHKALMLAYGKGVRRVGPRQIQRAAADTEGALAGVRARWVPWAIGGGLLVATGAAVVMALRGGLPV